MQKEHWEPLFQWAQQDLGVTLKRAEGFSPAVQGDEAIAKLRAIVEKFDIWQLAGESSYRI